MHYAREDDVGVENRPRRACAAHSAGAPSASRSRDHSAVRRSCSARRSSGARTQAVGPPAGAKAAEVALATPLVAERLPSRGLGARCELGEEHRLADAAQPVDDQALLAATARETAEQIREPLDLALPPHQGGRKRAGPRRVWVLKWIHPASLAISNIF